MSAIQQFADRDRLLPVSTREETVQSIRKAAAVQGLSEDTRSELQKYAGVWGVQGVYADAFIRPSMKTEPAKKTAAEVKYALEIRDEDGALVERRYALVCPEAAAGSFMREFRGIPAAQRKKAAEALLESGVTEAHALYTLARAGVASQAGIKKAASIRLGLYKTDAHKKIASDIANGTEDLNGSVAVTLFDLLDRREGLTKKYGSEGFDVPEAYIFNKMADECKASIKLTNGKCVDLDDIHELTKDQLGVLGDEVVDEVVTGDEVDYGKLATLLPTLPKPDADVLCSLIQD